MSLLNLLQYCFYFMFWFFGPKACRILAPRPEIEPVLPALEGKVLTTGPPGKSLGAFIIIGWIKYQLPQGTNHEKAKLFFLTWVYQKVRGTSPKLAYFTVICIELPPTDSSKCYELQNAQTEPPCKMVFSFNYGSIL